MSVVDFTRFLWAGFRRIYDDHGFLRTVAFSPLTVLLCLFVYDVVNDKPDDAEKVAAARRRSAKIDDWSELVSDGENE